MKLVILFIFLCISFAGAYPQIYPTKVHVQLVPEGVILHWPHAEEHDYFIYRGTSEENLELLELNQKIICSSSKCHYVDKTVEPNVEYFYKVESKIKKISIFNERPEDILWEGFFNHSHIGDTKNISISEYGHVFISGTGRKNAAVFTRYIKGMKRGQRYIVRVSFGVAIENNNVEIFINSKKPKKLILSPDDVLAYQNRTVDFEFSGGDPENSTLTIVSYSDKNKWGNMTIRRVLILPAD